MTTVARTRPKVPGQRPAPTTGPATYRPLRITCFPGKPRKPRKNGSEEEPEPAPEPDEEPALTGTSRSL
ncbi:hypothetical protein ACIRBX_14975 [Kitasatospora sp. NPDC096147]|uniref:hypothetical protein n=1 Tax=Kitasatospora sp. NPDC096147 TaxID=3364093 RepID=UPI003802E56D